MDNTPADSRSGYFPFGRPNVECAPRLPAGDARAMVIGVYPSAFHVGWTAPAYTKADGRTGKVAAMAVDVEPTVFWDGDDSDFEARRATWMEAVRFVEGDEPGQHGTISTTSPSANGSSGDKLRRYYLDPLGLDADEVAFTDVYPVFMTKTGTTNTSSSGKQPRRGQRDAVSTEYDAIADQLGYEPSSIPERIPRDALPGVAATRFGRRLVDELGRAAPPLVITLGEEPWKTLTLIPEVTAVPPVERFADLHGAAYGARGTIRVGRSEAEWLPLIHPGLLRPPSTADDQTGPSDEAPTRLGEWTRLHLQWGSER